MERITKEIIQKWKAPPIKFKDAAELDKKVDEYLAQCYGYQYIDTIDPETKEVKKSLQKIWINVPSIVGLANYLGCNYLTLYNFENESKYVDNPEMTLELRRSLIKSVNRAKQLIHEYTVQAAITNKSAQGPIFVLKNNFGWRDEQHITQDVTTHKEDVDFSNLSTEELRQLQQLLSRSLPQENISDAEFEEEPDPWE